MAVCVKCKREIHDNEISSKVRKCDYCEREIGCIYCLIPGTLEYRYCDEHNPKGKKDKKEDIKKYIRELCSDEAISKNAQIQLLKNSDVSVDVMIESLASEKNQHIRNEILNIFEKIGDEKTIDPILKTINEDYEKGFYDNIPQALSTLAAIHTERSVKEISLLSEHPDAEIRNTVFEFLIESSEDPKYNELLEKILDGRDISEVEEIYEKIPYLGDLDHRCRESAVRDLSAMNSKRELILTLASLNPLARASAVMCLGMNGKDDASVVEKIGSMTNDEDENVRASAAIALGNLRYYDKVFEMTADENINVRLSAVDALLSEKENTTAKELLNKITDESLSSYINNDEYRYSENVKREIKAREGYAAEFFIAKMLEECMSELKEIQRMDPDNFRAHINLGEVYMKKYMYEEAEKELREAIKIKDDAHAHLYLGDALMFMHRLDEAKKEYESALKMEEIQRAHKNIAEVYCIKEEYDEAIKEFGKILEVNPKDVSSRLELAGILEKTNRKKEAAEEYESVIKQDPFLVDPYVNLSMILIDGGKLKEAENNLRNAIKIHPKEPLICFVLGISLSHQKKFAEAERELKKCFSANTAFANSDESVEMHELLAEVIAAQGRMRESKMELFKAQRLKENGIGGENEKTPHTHAHAH